MGDTLSLYDQPMVLYDTLVVHKRTEFRILSLLWLLEHLSLNFHMLGDNVGFRKSF